MKKARRFLLYEMYPDEFVATSRGSVQPVAHSMSLRKLYAALKRKHINPAEVIVEKIPPKEAVVIYRVSLRRPG